MHLSLPPNDFTEVYHQVSEATTRYVIVYGGASSGKSYAVHQLELMNIMEAGTGDTLFIRKHGSDIRYSCFQLLQTLIKQWGMADEFEQRYSNDQRCITAQRSGRSIIFKGIDDAEKLKSIAGIKRIVIEEANQLEFKDFLELNRRARGMEGIQLIFILNPVSENHWIKTKFCDEGSPYFDSTSVLRFTYTNNRNATGASFLTTVDVTELERLKDIDENQYRIYVLAEWGVDNTEGKFCWSFTQQQIQPTVYNPEHILWASFDFNVNPLTCTVAQMIPEEQTLRAIECIKLPNSDIWKMCDRLQASYPHAVWHVTGDATGNSHSAMLQDGLTYFLIIQNRLGLTLQQMIVPPVNPRIELNRVLVNAIHKNWLVQIDPNRCQPLIYDLTYVEVNPQNQIMKDRTAPHRQADFLDTWRYLINMAVKPFFDY